MFLTSSQRTPQLLAEGPHLEKDRCKRDETLLDLKKEEEVTGQGMWKPLENGKGKETDFQGVMQPCQDLSDSPVTLVLGF